MENYNDKNEEIKNSSQEKQERDIFERTSHYDPLAKNEEASEASYADAGKSDGDIKITSPFLKKLENFFYHYKWHTIIAAFFVFVITLCVVQTCKRTSYDAYVLYAGGKNLRTLEEGETESTCTILYKSAGLYVGDYNSDQERNLSLLDIYLPSDDEIKELEKEGNVPYNLLKDNDELFRNNMLSGNYYVCMISKYLLDEWTNKGTNPFAPVSLYLPEGAKIASGENDEGYRLASEYGVYLSSTPLKDKPGFKYLPEDTVLCFRKYSKAAAPGKRGKTVYDNSEKLFRAMLVGKIYE
ncbi:MAG: hypothetical protein E7673_00225 [Ruminococcaceae bacterium]|nr:hypothetical protein [Oscillospiraceae bacterium]